MNKEQKIVAATDFSNSRIAVAVAHKNSDGMLELIDIQDNTNIGSIIKNGIIVDENAVAGKLKTLVEHIENEHKIKIGVFHYAVAPHTLRSEIREVSCTGSGNIANDLDTLKSAVHNVVIDNKRVFKVIPNETIIGTKISGKFLTLIVQDVVNKRFNLAKLVIGNELNPEFFVSPLVEADVFLTDAQKQNGAILVDFGAGCTSFVAYQSGFPRVCAVIPLGSEHITKDIMQKYKISKKDADDLKFRLAKSDGFSVAIGESSVKGTEIKEVVCHRIDEIFGFIFAEMENQNIENIKDMVLAGGGANLKFLPEYLSKLNEMTVKTVDIEVFTKNKNFTKLENALLFALLKNCNEDCKKVGIKVETRVNAKPVKPFRKSTLWDKIKNSGMPDMFANETPIQK